ncbi:hypothetical protein OG298_05655 [Streptomyces sp. NBC_01005]|uniref:hypothetical protein n=1 Tax=unclassified Streptomyces TaxID=2593676 RepID=UPI002E2FFD92|nr:hypothetical protein [Streptomyces sp. NBC_01362]WSW03861.1 hypothetical protein OG298_05655 [Streptomyces sp. NBC_01005]WTC93365.1 hypothetical protein OH736_05650 [Streptomyces sp. NBC_01650]
MATTRAPRPFLVQPRGACFTVFASLSSAVLALGSGGAAVFCAVSVATVGATPAVAIPVVLALVAAAFALAMVEVVFSLWDNRRATVELAAVGVDATALVLSAVFSPLGGEEPPEVRLLVRISGPGFEPFETDNTVEVHLFPGVAEGAVLPARVNPANLNFSM